MPAAFSWSLISYFLKFGNHQQFHGKKKAHFIPSTLNTGQNQKEAEKKKESELNQVQSNNN